jgi:hypothetical protein
MNNKGISLDRNFKTTECFTNWCRIIEEIKLRNTNLAICTPYQWYHTKTDETSTETDFDFKHIIGLRLTISSRLIRFER